jgi:predicted permease
MLRWIVGWSEIRVDERTLAFTTALTLATTLVFGLAPALRATRLDIVDALKSGSRGSAAARQRVRGALVALQVTLALVLVSGATFMTRGFFSLVDLYQGYDPERVVTLRAKLPPSQYPEPEAIASFYERVTSALQAAPGIQSAGLVSHLPADLGPIPRTSFVVEGRPLLRAQEKPAADLQTISPGSLDALKVAVHSGRGLTTADGVGAPPVALVSRSLAERFWPGEHPIGRRIRIGDDGAWRTVVGVVQDVKQYWFDREPRPTVYVSYLQSPRRDLFLVLRSTLDTAAVVAIARDRVREADRQQPLDEIRTMATIVSESASFIRVSSVLMAVLGAVALLLAAVGLFGVVAEHASSRRHEIGVRMALGACGADVRRLLMSQAARLAAIGVGFGLVGAFALGRVMEGALFGITRPDAASLAAVTAALAAAALAAAWVPVRRATRVDPVLALRDE